MVKDWFVKVILFIYFLMIVGKEFITDDCAKWLAKYGLTWEDILISTILTGAFIIALCSLDSYVINMRH